MLSDFSHEIKRRLLLGRKVMTNIDSIFKSRDITLPTKVRLVKAMVFPLAPSLHSFWSFFSTLLQEYIGYLPTWGVHLSVSYLFAFSYCSWGSQGKNTGLSFPSPVDQVLSEVSSMTCPSWVALHGMAHSFNELDKAVVYVISLVSFL